MLKRFTLLASSLLAAFSIAAQETTPTASASFATEDEGKTLVVSGKGDLTKLNITATELSFTTDGLSNVKTTNNEYGTAATNPYNSKTTYYAKHYVETQVEADALQNATVTYSWTAAGLSLYYTSDNGWTWTQVTSGSSVDLTDNWDNNIQYSKYSTTNDKTGRITLADFKSGGYYTTTITGDNITFNWSASNYYQKTEEGYQAMAQNDTYDSNTTYYKSVFGVVTETEMQESGYLDYVTDSFVNLLNAMILDGAKPENNGVTTNFTTVRFVNEGSPTPLIINDEIVHAILFPTYDWGYGVVTKAKNYSIETLDLGAATIIDLNADAFKNGNSLANMTNLTLPLTQKTWVYSETATNTKVEKMVLPEDVLNGYKDYKTGDANIKTVTIPEGYDRLGDNAFNGQNRVETFILPSSLKLIGNSAFKDCYAMTSITLNDGLENIGKSAFVGSGLTDITFPSTLRIINDAAFAGLKIMDLKFNAGLKYIGNSAFALTEEMTVKTIEIPASVKYIGPFAFNFRQYQDVFFLGEEAPIMPIGNSAYQTGWTDGTAFSAHTLMGNNGFDSGTQGDMPTATNMKDDAHNGYANRENYKNGSYYFCILHFPTGLTDKQRAKYTDITRVYKTNREDNGDFHFSRSEDPDSYDNVGQETETLTFGACTAYKQVCYGYEDTYLGSQYIWPSQEQWNRSYAVNSNGYNWDGKTPYRTELTDEDIEVLAYAGYKQVTVDHPSTGDGYYTLDELKKIAHMGTRQFVLTNADTKKDEKPEEEPVYPISMKGSNWWTICVPFNMTKAQVDEVFGSGTHVCRFSSVTRTDDGKGNKSITLRFQNDVYATKWTRDAKTLAYNKESGSPANDDIVIYSHEAYMIYPTKSSEDANGMYNIKDYKLETGSPLPTIIKANANETENADQTEYRFVGNYVTEVSTGTATNADEGVATADFKEVTIPQYSYIYAKKKNDTAYKFWFFTGTQMAWSPNKCVVQATKRDGGLTDYNNFFGGNANSTKVTQMSLFGEETDGGTTGINEEITIIAGEGDNAQRVYNLNGQMIGGNNAKPKGIYIKGGKKFMVK